jgi:hypothetical protein
MKKQEDYMMINFINFAKAVGHFVVCLVDIYSFVIARLRGTKQSRQSNRNTMVSLTTVYENTHPVRSASTPMIEGNYWCASHGLFSYSQKVMSCLILIMVAMILFCGCTKKPYDPEKDESYWKEMNFTPGQLKNIRNAFATKDKLYAAVRGTFDAEGITTVGGIYIFDDLTSTPSFIPCPDMSPYFNFVPVMSKDFTAYFEGIFYDDRNVIHFTGHRKLSANKVTLRPSDFGDEFTDYIFLQGNDVVEFGAFSSGNRFMGVMGARRNAHNFNNYFVYVDLGFDAHDNPIILDKGLYNVSPFNNTELHLHRMRFMGNDFYFSLTGFMIESSWLLKISQFGDVYYSQNPFNSMPARTFWEYRGYKWVDTTLQLLLSIDEGISWSVVVAISPPAWHAVEVGDHLFSLHRQIIGCHYLDSLSVYHLHQAPISNIGSRQMSSVLEYKDHLIITTFDGIFYQSIDKVLNDVKHSISFQINI